MGEDVTDTSPSTSFAFLSKDLVLLSAMSVFERLNITGHSTIDTKKKNNIRLLKPPPVSMERYLPYVLPAQFRKRIVKERKKDDYFKKLIHVKLDGDVEPLKLAIFDKKESCAPCSVQAVRPPTPDDAVDELAEYFTHFVCVESKMSALAESMYV